MTTAYLELDEHLEANPVPVKTVMIVERPHNHGSMIITWTNGATVTIQWASYRIAILYAHGLRQFRGASVITVPLGQCSGDYADD